jgi:hypothetical protein
VSEPHDVVTLFAAYAATAERWHELRADARAANAVFDENERLARELRCSSKGRAAIATLISHEATGVRVLAAAHSLEFCPDEATVALEALAAGDGLHAVAAGYALEEYARAGTQELDR